MSEIVYTMQLRALASVLTGGGELSKDVGCVIKLVLLALAMARKAASLAKRAFNSVQAVSASRSKLSLLLV